MHTKNNILQVSITGANLFLAWYLITTTTITLFHLDTNTLLI
jgi:hypothetical protein